MTVVISLQFSGVSYKLGILPLPFQKVRACSNQITVQSVTTWFLSNFRFRSQTILSLGVVVTPFITGCVANVPVRTDRPTGSFEIDYVKTHLQSTKQEIVQKLGLPWVVLHSEQQTYYVYKASDDLRRVTGVVLVVPPYFVPFFTAKEDGDALHCLVLVFDKAGLLQGYKTASGNESALLGMLTPLGVVEGPTIGKEETGCLKALWNDKKIRSLEVSTVYEKIVCPKIILDEAKRLCPQADNGIIDSQRRIGDLLYCGSAAISSDGEIPDNDLVRVYVWYSLAAIGGDSRDRARLMTVEKELSNDALKEAQYRLEAWKPGQCIKDLVEAGLLSNDKLD